MTITGEALAPNTPPTDAGAARQMIDGFGRLDPRVFIYKKYSGGSDARGIN